MAKLTIEFESRVVTIESEVVTGDEFVQDLFKPALLALQFHPDTVDNVLGKSE